MSLSRRLANLGKAIDSATTGHFLSKGDSDGLFETIQYTDLTGRPTVLDSANISAIVDSAYVQLRQTSVGSGGLDSAAVTTLVDSAYVSARSPAAASGFAAYEYNTSAAQTTFQDSDVNGNVLSYSENGIIVYYNGVLMPTSDYTATDGSSVVFTTAVDSGGTVTIAKWALASSGGSGGSAGPSYLGDRGIMAGGNDGSVRINEIDYFDITTTGNATDFGDLLTALGYHAGNMSDKTYGVFAGGYTGSTAGIVDIQYITIASTGNSSDFGDLQGTAWINVGLSDDTRGVITRTFQVNMDYITIATPGNATTFGTMATQVNYRAPASDGTYGLFAGGSGPVNNIDYITIQTTSNTSDFGDLTVARQGPGGVSSETYGVFAGGYLDTTIDYVTIATPGNATDFGDLITGKQFPAGTSNGTRGVFMGGNDETNRVNTIEYVTIDTPGNASDFGDLQSGKDNGAGTSGNAA